MKIWIKNQNPQQRKGCSKGEGMYRIDRGAEQAVYEVLHKKLKAHSRRWGEEID